MTEQEAQRLLEGLEEIHQIIREMRNDLLEDSKRTSSSLQDASNSLQAH